MSDGFNVTFVGGINSSVGWDLPEEKEEEEEEGGGRSWNFGHKMRRPCEFTFQWQGGRARELWKLFHANGPVIVDAPDDDVLLCAASQKASGANGPLRRRRRRPPAPPAPPAAGKLGLGWAFV